jgi:hypothetical protein
LASRLEAVAHENHDNDDAVGDDDDDDSIDVSDRRHEDDVGDTHDHDDNDDNVDDEAPDPEYGSKSHRHPTDDDKSDKTQLPSSIPIASVVDASPVVAVASSSSSSRSRPVSQKSVSVRPITTSNSTSTPPAQTELPTIDSGSSSRPVSQSTLSSTHTPPQQAPHDNAQNNGVPSSMIEPTFVEDPSRATAAHNDNNSDDNDEEEASSEVISATPTSSVLPAVLRQENATPALVSRPLSQHTKTVSHTSTAAPTTSSPIPSTTTTTREAITTPQPGPLTASSSHSSTRSSPLSQQAASVHISPVIGASGATQAATSAASSLSRTSGQTPSRIPSFKHSLITAPTITSAPSTAVTSSSIPVAMDSKRATTAPTSAVTLRSHHDEDLEGSYDDPSLITNNKASTKMVGKDADGTGYRISGEDATLLEEALEADVERFFKAAQNKKVTASVAASSSNVIKPAKRQSKPAVSTIPTLSTSVGEVAPIPSPQPHRRPATMTPTPIVTATAGPVIAHVASSLPIAPPVVPNTSLPIENAMVSQQQQRVIPVAVPRSSAVVASTRASPTPIGPIPPPPSFEVSRVATARVESAAPNAPIASSSEMYSDPPSPSSIVSGSPYISQQPSSSSLIAPVVPPPSSKPRAQDIIGSASTAAANPTITNEAAIARQQQRQRMDNIATSSVTSHDIDDNDVDDNDEDTGGRIQVAEGANRWLDMDTTPSTPSTASSNSTTNNNGARVVIAPTRARADLSSASSVASYPSAHPLLVDHASLASSAQASSNESPQSTQSPTYAYPYQFPETKDSDGSRVQYLYAASPEFGHPPPQPLQSNFSIAPAVSPHAVPSKVAAKVSVVAPSSLSKPPHYHDTQLQQSSASVSSSSSIIVGPTGLPMPRPLPIHTSATATATVVAKKPSAASIIGPTAAAAIAKPAKKVNSGVTSSIPPKTVIRPLAQTSSDASYASSISTTSSIISHASIAPMAPIIPIARGIGGMKPAAVAPLSSSSTSISKKPTVVSGGTPLRTVATTKATSTVNQKRETDDAVTKAEAALELELDDLNRRLADKRRRVADAAKMKELQRQHQQESAATVTPTPIATTTATTSTKVKSSGVAAKKRTIPASQSSIESNGKTDIAKKHAAAVAATTKAGGDKKKKRATATGVPASSLAGNNDDQSDMYRPRSLPGFEAHDEVDHPIVTATSVRYVHLLHAVSLLPLIVWCDL